MHAVLHARLQTLQSLQEEVLVELHSWPEASRSQRPAPGRWSGLEILEHLILAERDILGGLPPREALVARPRSLRNRAIRLLVVGVLRFAIPVKVPTRRMLPTGEASLADLEATWAATHRWLGDLVEGLAPGEGDPAWFRHPVAGPITVDQALSMDALHLKVHLRQLRRLRPRA